MRKLSIYSIVVTLITLTVNKINAQTVSLLKTTYINHYPSASGVAYFDKQLYIIGDDAQKLLVLDTEHKIIDSITFFAHTEKRIPYQIKPDLESLSLITYKTKPYLVSLPSYSTTQRNRVYIFPIKDINRFKLISNSAPLDYLKEIGIQEPNVEGSTVLKKKLVVSNRANQAQPINYLVTIPLKKRSLRKSSQWKVTKLNLPNPNNNQLGLSGMDYYSELDCLFFTASSEATSSATADGTIGESYIGYVSNFSKIAGNQNISPNKLINVSKELNIGNQKIEGICIESSNINGIIIHLVADNDDGQSIVYKVQLTF